MRHRRVGGRAVTVTAMLHRQRYTVRKEETRKRLGIPRIILYTNCIQDDQGDDREKVGPMTAS